MKSTLISLTLLSGSVAHADQGAPVSAPKIYYQSRVPSSVSRLMPRGAKSCFWGTFRTTPNGPTYGVHLFKADPKQGQKSEGFKRRQEFALDIFLAKRASFKRINRMAVNYASLAWGVSRFAAVWTYVEPQRQQVPVLRFDIWSPDGIYGNIGENVYLSFPKGFENRANVQSLQFGAWSASDCRGQSNQFVRGGDGRTEIYSSLYPATGELTPEQVEQDYRFTLQWDSDRTNSGPQKKPGMSLKSFPICSRTWIRGNSAQPTNSVRPGASSERFHLQRTTLGKSPK